MTDSFNLGERSRPLLSRQVIRDAIITQRTGISLNSKNTQSDRILLQWSIEKKGEFKFLHFCNSKCLFYYRKLETFCL